MVLVRLTIMQRLTTLLEGITEFTYSDASGVEKTVSYDLVGQVFRGRRDVSREVIGDVALSILEQPRPTLGDPAGLEGVARKVEWTLNIQGWPKEDRDHPSDPAYVLAGAVEERLKRLIATHPESGDPRHPEFMFGRLVSGVAIGTPLVIPPTEALSTVAFFYIPLTITLART